jgi:hypothetical protein
VIGPFVSLITWWPWTRWRLIFATLSSPRLVVLDPWSLLTRCGKQLHSFNVALEAMVVAAAEPEDFIVFLPDVATADRVFNGGALLQAPSFPLFFRCGTRVAHVEAAALLSLVQVELRNIPAQVWWRSTTQQLLGGGCWVQELHADTVALRDLSVF